MSAASRAEKTSGGCDACLRRSWLLSELSPSLEYQCRDRGRLIDLLTLADGDLLHAVGGRRRGELEARYARFDRSDLLPVEGVEAVCRHDRYFPLAPRDPGSPHMLHVMGGVRRLEGLMAAPTASIIGSARATDYGMEMAKSLARGLAASGVTIVGGLSDGIPVAAHAGALEVAGGTVTVMAGGLDVACPARRRSLYDRARRRGCAVAELPSGSTPRRWGQVAGERILARLARLTVVVEARDTPGELAGAQLAQAVGSVVAAVPGRVTSPASTGPHALLIGGAHLVRGPADALELLCGQDTPATPPTAPSAALEPRLKAMFDKVGAGWDTPEKLTDDGQDAGEVLLALSELELMGLLARGDGGRYVPRDVLHA